MATLNPNGAVIVFDGGNPRTFSAKAREAISGGQLVVSSGAANSVGATASTYATSDVVVTALKNSNYANGMALNNAGSNEVVTVLTQGAAIVRAAGIISGGQLVYGVSGTNQGVAGQPITGYSGGQIAIGKALTPSASGTALYTLVDFNF